MVLQWQAIMCVSTDLSTPGEIAEALSIHLVLKHIRGEEVHAIAMSACDRKIFSLTRRYAAARAFDPRVSLLIQFGVTVSRFVIQQPSASPGLGSAYQDVPAQIMHSSRYVEAIYGLF